MVSLVPLAATLFVVFGAVATFSAAAAAVDGAKFALAAVIVGFVALDLVALDFAVFDLLCPSSVKALEEADFLLCAAALVAVAGDLSEKV